MHTLLMISYPFPPNLSAGAVRSERFARYMAKFGWNVEVITIGRRANVYHDETRLAQLPEEVSIKNTSIYLRSPFKPAGLVMQHHL